MVTYGNREYEDALLELKNLAQGLGLRPVAGGAFIGEHSVSSNDMPIAEGRPDVADVKKAQEFGKNIRDLLGGINSVNDLSSLQLPGNFPYKERREPSRTAPFVDEMLCTKCEICVTVCPTAAITVNDAVYTNPDTCIRCCACIKSCPTQALYFNNPGLKRLAEWLYTNYNKRKEPELYLSCQA